MSHVAACHNEGSNQTDTKHQISQAGVPWWGARGKLGLLVLKNALRGANYSSHSKLLVLNNIQYFYIRICRTKIRNREYLEHCSGNILLFSDAIILHRLWE